jgi:tetratricopeptide (TPR) repeat protein
MKYGLTMMGVLLCSLALCGQRNALPNPDRYPADSVIVMLREDTAANQFKAWVINRTDSTMVLEAINRVAEDWLEVKDDENVWRVYNSDSRQIDCPMGFSFSFPLRKNHFVKVSTTRTPGTFQTLARARFTLDGMPYYSSEMAVSIDTFEFLHPYLKQLVRFLRRIPKDSTNHRSRLVYYLGLTFAAKNRFADASEKYAEALALNPNNYQAIISQGDLRIRQGSQTKLKDPEISRIIKAIFASFEIIPNTEEELQEKIELRRKAYARWLED